MTFKNIKLGWEIGRYFLYAFTAAAIAFGVSEWVTDKYVKGFDSSIAGLNSSIDRLNQSVTSVNHSVLSVNQELNQQLVEMREQRNEINIQFTKQIERLRGDGVGLRKDIKLLGEELRDIKSSLANIQKASNVQLGPNGIEWLHSEQYLNMVKGLGIDPKKGGAPIIIGPYTPPKN